MSSRFPLLSRKFGRCFSSEIHLCISLGLTEWIHLVSAWTTYFWASRDWARGNTPLFSISLVHCNGRSWRHFFLPEVFPFFWVLFLQRRQISRRSTCIHTQVSLQLLGKPCRILAQPTHIWQYWVMGPIVSSAQLYVHNLIVFFILLFLLIPKLYSCWK